jgi:hypothetical protein
MSAAPIIMWRPVTSYTYQPYFVSFLFTPTLCQILRISRAKKMSCTITGTDTYDGTYMCVFDMLRGAHDGVPIYIGTLPISWRDDPESLGTVAIP